MSNTPSLSQRGKFYWDCINPIGRWLLRVYAVLGAISWIRDEFLLESWKTYHGIDLLPVWPLYLWIAIGIFILIIAMVEIVFRKLRLIEEARSPSKIVVDSLGNPYERPTKRGASIFVAPVCIVALLAGTYLFWPWLEPPAFRENVEQIIFSLGGGGVHAGYMPERLRQGPVEPFSIGGYSPVTLRMAKDTILLTVKVWSARGQSPIEVINNEFVVRPPQWDKNSTAKALEVVNEKGLPVFQLIRQTSSHLIVNGVFPFPNGMFIATDKLLVLNPSENTLRETLASLTPIFKYPSWKYPGQYVQQ
jgi:hypothetical protein